MSKFFQIPAICMALIVSSSAAALAQTADERVNDYFSEYPGVYAGSYICGNGENGMTLVFDTFEDIMAANWPPTAEVEARLWFYDLASNPGHPRGAFSLAGLYRNGTLEMDPTGWISEPPPNWGAAGITGEFKRDASGQMTFAGSPTGAGTQSCQAFVLHRLDGF